MSPYYRRAADLTGRVVGRLTVLERLFSPTDTWHCRCLCGQETIVRGDALRKPHPTESCGCLKNETLVARCRTHGGYGRPEYQVWRGMIGRCENPTHAAYRRYGWRGIYVCETWRHDFASFFHDMGPRPSARHSIERIDNKGPYAPENCRWATMKEQLLNTSVSRSVIFEGSRISLLELSRRFNVPWGTLYRRVTVVGQDAVEAAREIASRPRRRQMNCSHVVSSASPGPTPAGPR